MSETNSTSDPVYSVEDIDTEQYEFDLASDIVARDPEVVCLCGSTRFKEEYRAMSRKFEIDGKIVLSVGFFGHADDVEMTSEEKRKVDALHKRKIELADRIYVINVGGYVGESTRSEIAYAAELDKDITFLETEK